MRIGSAFSRLKITVTKEIRCSSLPYIIVSAVLTAFFFAVSVISVRNNICDCELILPHLTPAPFFMILFRIIAGATLGAVFGFLIGAAGCNCRCLGAAVLVLLAVIIELMWFPLLFSLTLPFLALLDLLLIGFLSMLAIFSMRFCFVTVISAMMLHIVMLIVRIIFCISVVSVN